MQIFTIYAYHYVIGNVLVLIFKNLDSLEDAYLLSNLRQCSGRRGRSKEHAICLQYMSLCPEH